MQGVIYEGKSFLVFFFVTIVLGGGAAWITGRSTAQSWRPWTVLLGWSVLLGVAVRFIHYALFTQTFFTFYYYAIDTIFLIVIGSIAYRYTMAQQMVRQYGWLYERAGPFGWRSKSGAGA
jgi:hypothetical protein